MPGVLGNALGAVSQFGGGAPWAGSLPSPDVAAMPPSDTPVSSPSDTSGIMPVNWTGATTAPGHWSDIGMGVTSTPSTPSASPSSYPPADPLMVAPVAPAGVAGSPSDPATDVANTLGSTLSKTSAAPLNLAAAGVEPPPLPPAAVAQGSSWVNPSGNDPEQSLVSKVISAITGKDVGKGGVGTLIGMGGNLADNITKWIQQRQLRDPNSLLSQSQILAKGLNKNLVGSVSRRVGDVMDLRGAGGAPGLVAQANAEALAPYKQQQDIAAMQAWLNANQIAMGAYPGGEPYGGYGRYPGEQASA